MFQCLRKIHPLHQHNKAVDITPTTTRKVMPNSLLRTDHKTRCSLVSERTQSLEIAPSPLELHVFTDHIFDRQPLSDVLFGILHDSSIAPFTSLSLETFVLK